MPIKFCTSRCGNLFRRWAEYGPWQRYVPNIAYCARKNKKVKLNWINGDYHIWDITIRHAATPSLCLINIADNRFFEWNITLAFVGVLHLYHGFIDITIILVVFWVCDIFLGWVLKQFGSPIRISVLAMYYGSFYTHTSKRCASRITHIKRNHWRFTKAEWRIFIILSVLKSAMKKYLLSILHQWLFLLQQTLQSKDETIVRNVLETAPCTWNEGNVENLKVTGRGFTDVYW